MRRLAFLITMGVFFSSGLLAQEFFMSGGTRYSVALCASGNIITWGSNGAGQLARNKKANGTAIGFATVTTSDGAVTEAADWSPTAVTLKDASGASIMVSAVDAGSGAHAIGLACDGSVWTWGGNEHGQLGNGSVSSSYSTTNQNNKCTDVTSVDATATSNQATICNKMNAQHVLAGETNLAAPFTGYLKNVVYVTASTSASFAIVKDPTTGVTNLVAWGSNKDYKMHCEAQGQLGNGLSTTQMDASAYPVYVKYKNAAGALVRLTNVIAVDAGDNNCFAIVDDDNDGDPTTGTVYGWGRNVANNIVPTSTTAVLFATPVTTDAAGTKPLTGIKMISAGDGFLLAYDKTGYLWSVGSEWCASGSVESTRANGKAAWTNPKEAAKVISGDVSTYNGGDSYMGNVKGISAGQSSAMAMVELTIGGKTSNYVAAWGSAYGSEDKPAAGGCVNDLASKDALGSLNPRMAYRTNWRTGAVVMIDSVVALSDGDGVMYALRLEKDKNGVQIRQLYVSGSNGAGQLGFDIATSKGTCVFTKLDLPGCEMGAPCAKADLAPFKLCPGETKTLFAGSEGVTSYHYVWQRYDSNGDYTADGNPGWYELNSCEASNTTNADNTLWTFDGTGPKATAAQIAARVRCDGDNARYGIDMDGQYKVSIYDTRPKAGCNTCPTVTATTTINYSTAPIDTTPGKWCGTATELYKLQVIEPAYAAANVTQKFLVYGSDNPTLVTNNKVLATVDKTNIATGFTLNTADLTNLGVDKNGDIVYGAWVGDSTRISATLFASTATTGSGIANYNPSAISTAQNGYFFTAYSDFVFKSFDILAKRNDATSATITVIANIYKAATNSKGGYSKGALVVSGSKAITVTGTTLTRYPVEINALVPGESSGRAMYVMELAFQSTKDVTFEGPSLMPVGNISGVVSVSYGGGFDASGINYGNPLGTPSTMNMITNWVIQKTTMYNCGRIPIRFKKDCPPCKDPFLGEKSGTFKITATGLSVGGDVCPGKSVVLTTDAVQAGYADSVVSFAWIKGAPSATNPIPATAWTTVKTGIKAGTNTITAGTVDATTDWYVVARHAAYPNDFTCYDTARITVKEHASPTYTLGGGGSYCEKTTSPDITVQLGKVAADTTGKTPWKIVYHFNKANPATTGAKTVYTVTSAAKENVHAFTALGAGTFVLDSIYDKYCGIITPDATKTNTEIKLLDSAWVTTRAAMKVCASASLPSIVVNTVTGGTYTWWYKKNGGSTFLKQTNATASLASPAAGQYYVEFTTTGTPSCVSKTVVDTVVKYPLPEFTLAGGKTYCAGDSISNVVLTMTKDTISGANYGPWSVVPTIDGTASAAITKAAATTLPKVDLGIVAGTYKATVTNTKTGCVSSNTLSDKIVINQSLTLVFAKPKNFCTGVVSSEFVGSSLDLSQFVSAPTAATGVFSKTDLTYAIMPKGTVPVAADYKVSPSFTNTSVSGSTDVTYDLYAKWSKTGCPAIDSTQITIYAKPTATIALGKTDACLNEAVTATATPLGAAVKTHLWTINPTAPTAALLTGSATATATITPTYRGAIPVSYVVTDINGCVSTAATATLTGHDKPVVAITTTDLAYCSYESAVTFTATANNPATSAAYVAPAAGTGAWTCSVTAAMTGASFNPKATGLDKTATGNTVTYTYTDAYNCSNSANVKVVINDPTVVTINNSDTAFCEYEPAVTIMFASTTAFTVDNSKFTAVAGVSGGKFDPKTASKTAATPVEYLYTDVATQCTTVVKRDFKSNPKPDAKFIATTPTQICKGAGTVDFKQYANPAYPVVLPAKQTMLIAGIAGTSLDAATAISPVTVTYQYEDANGCKDTATTSVAIFKPTTPTDEVITGLIKSTFEAANGVGSFVYPVFKAKGITAGNTYKWYDKNGTELTANADLVVKNITPAVDFDAVTPISWKLVQYDGTCASDFATVTWNPFDCSYTKTPDATPAVKCFEPTMPNADRTVSATATNGGGAIYWFSKNAAVKGSAEQLAFATNDYTFPQSTASATQDIKTVYAFEYNAVEDCFSPSIAVSLTINPKPVINVTIPELCWNRSPYTLTVTPAGGMLSINGGAATTSMVLDPKTILGDTTGKVAKNTIPVTFTYTSPATSGSCKAIDVPANIVINYVSKPTTKDETYSISAVNKDNTITILTAAHGKNMGTPTTSWYNVSNIGNTKSLFDGLKYSTGLTAINVIGTKDGDKFYIRSTDANTCNSDSVPVTIRIINCPTPAPIFVKDTLHVCSGLKDVSIAVNTAAPYNPAGTYSGYKWYTTSAKSAKYSGIADGSSSFTFVKPTANVEVWVTQFGDDGASGQCESPAAKATITVNAMPNVTITTTPDLCMLDKPTFELIGASDITTGTGYYAVKNASGTYDKLSSNGFTPPYDTTTGKNRIDNSYEVAYFYTTAASCSGSASTTVNNHFVPRPTVVGASYMRPTIVAPITLAATAPIGTVNWSAVVNMTAPKPEPFTTDLTKDKGIGNYFYYATQTLTYTPSTKTCTSLPSEATIYLFDCPVQKPSLGGGDDTYCIYDTQLDWTTTSGGRSSGFTRGTPDKIEYRWYSEDPFKNASAKYNTSLTESVSGLTGTIKPLTPVNSNLVKGEYPFFVVEYDDKYKCFGPAEKLVITVNDRAKPILTVSSGKICQEVVTGSPIAVTVGNWKTTDKVYIFKTLPVQYDANGVTPQATDKYTTTDVVPGEHRYWVVLNDGCFSDTTSIKFTINPTPVAPAVKGFSSCQNVPATGTLSVVSPIATNKYNWYYTKSGADADKTSTKANVQNKTAIAPQDDDVTVDGTYSYYVRTVSADGCVSPVSLPADFVVRKQPLKPSLTGNGNLICSSWDLPVVTIARDKDTVRLNGVLTTATSYQIKASDIVGSSAVIKATQIVDGCESNIATPATFVLNVVPNPTTTFKGSQETCFGVATKEIEIKPASLTARWFKTNADSDTVDVDTIGKAYKPRLEDLVLGVNKFYVREVKRQGDVECFGPASTVTYTTIDKPAAPDFGLNDRFRYCSADALGTVTATKNPGVSSGGYYTWFINRKVSPDPVTVDDNFGVQQLYNLQNGLNTVSVRFTTVPTGCPSDIVDKDIWIHKTPDAPGIPNIDTTTVLINGFRYNENQLRSCEGDTVKLVANSWAVYKEWSVYSNVDTVLYETNPAIVKKTPTPGTRYKWHLRTYNRYVKNGVAMECDAPAVEGWIQVIKTPRPTILGAETYCEGIPGSSAPYKASIPAGTEFDSVYWYSTPNFRLENLYKDDKDPLHLSKKKSGDTKVGIDTIKLSAFYTRNGLTCAGKTEKVVKTAQKPVVTFDYTIPGHGFQVRFLNKTTQDSIRGMKYDSVKKKMVEVAYPVTNQYSWDFGRETDVKPVVYTFSQDSAQRVATDDAKKPPLPLKEKFEYGYHDIVLTAKSDYGCEVKYTGQIFVDIQKAMYFPNVMVVPGNGSEMISQFRVKGFNFRSFKLTIYDQWGNLLWMTDKLKDYQPLEGWDGTFNGQPMKEDVYIWRVEAEFVDGRAWDGPEFGNFTLLRN